MSTIQPRPAPADRVPLSYHQEQVWLTDRMLGSAAVSGPSLCVELRGPLDAAALHRAVAALVDRHEALRTSFDVVDGEPVQWVPAVSAPDHAVVDLAGRSLAECVDECAAEIRRGFDLRAGRLLRSRLYRLGEQHHVLLFARHHIATDGRSDELIAAELSALYRREATGAEAALPALPVQYPDYARWQRDRLRGPLVEGLLLRWSEALAGVAAEVALPLDRERPRRRASVGRSFAVAVPAPVAARAAQLARAERVSLFMLLLAVFRVMLWRQTGQRDVLIATPVESRLRPEVRDLVGCFVDALPLRGDLHGDPPVRELLAREKAATLAAFARQELPFPLLARELARHGRAPTIQVTFSYQVGDLPVPELPGLAVSPVALGRVTSQFDLMVKVIKESREGTSLLLECAYDDEILDEATVAGLADGFLTALDAATAEPGTPISQLPVPSLGARQPGSAAPPPPSAQVLVWATGGADDAPSGPVQELIAGLWAQALGVDPPGVHVSLLDCGGHSLTAAKLAYRLQEALGIEVSVADIFDHQTIAEQAEFVERALAELLTVVKPGL